MSVSCQADNETACAGHGDMQRGWDGREIKLYLEIDLWEDICAIMVYGTTQRG